MLFLISSIEKSTDRDLVNSILDVEDLVKFGNKQRWDLCVHAHLMVSFANKNLCPLLVKSSETEA